MRHAGGGFLGGAQAQEESLARSGALYPCLMAQPSYYTRNRAHPDAFYLDIVLYSPRVPFFRDDDGGWLDAPVHAGVVTAAAPNVGVLRQHGPVDAAAVEACLRRRSELVLATFAHHGEQRLVLGAWGAGVFGNDPVMVARAFADHLPRELASVTFAIMGGPGGANYDAFAKRFG